jgi:predicted negative regulator of RcsB-dependent stress response
VEAVVKKLFVLVLLAAAGAVAWRKVQSDRAEQALWAEVTDPVR